MNTKALYKNGIKIIEQTDSYNNLAQSTKPQINSVVLEGNRTAQELNLMTQDEIRQLIAQSRDVLKVNSYPATPQENILYYVGTTTPYNVCMYAKDENDNLVRIDMGTTNVDIDSKQDIVDNNLGTVSKNIVGAINEVFTEVNKKQNTLDDNLLTTNKSIVPAINELYNGKVNNNAYYDTDKTRQELFEASVTGSNVFNTAFTNEESPIGSNSARFMVFVNKNNYNRGGMIAQQTNITGDTQGDIFTCFLTNSGWSDWQFALQNRYAPISSVFDYGTTDWAVNPNDAVFGMKSLSSGVEVQQRVFRNSFITDPVVGGNCWGRLEVVERNVRDSTVSIWQTLIVTSNVVIDNQVVVQNKVFKRNGLHYGAGNTIYDNRASIEWKGWYPTEYPLTPVTINSTNFSSGSVKFTINGGILLFHVDGVGIAPEKTGTLVMCELPALPYKATSNGVNRSYVRSSIVNVTQSLPLLLHFDSGNNNRVSIFGVTTSNGGWYGQMSIPLGY